MVFGSDETVALQEGILTIQSPDKNIAKILPSRSTLREWATRQNGTVSWFVYRGTGEAVR